MKKLYTLSLSLLTISLSLAQASDPFMGTGSLNANGWVTHSGTAGQQTITAGSLTYSGFTTQGNRTQIIAGNSEDVNLASATPLTGNAYYSALINLPNADGLALNTDAVGNYFLMFGTTAGASVTNFYGRIYIRTGSTAGTFNLGVLNGPGGTAAPTYSAIDYVPGTTYFVVVKYDRTANSASLFVNPALGGSEGTPTVTNATGTTVLGATTNLLSLAIRQAGNATAGTGNIDIDEVRMGDSWAYVTAATLKNNQNSISGLKIYPNPVTKGTLFIETSANATKSVAIYDVLGKQVLTASTVDNAVNVSSLNSGVYVIKITEEGKSVTRKLVVN
ncbi:T9SS type A sorting domain-containing protein [Flavobacterium silvisoli]|uniref:T9SS type A sorting domain-containing protein n=1 Tax=Flavobacterium silvisoli TaxID=2529433 RepID=A0A4Q9Z2Q7_9FLAO|nr:T9SS type A sorting domain-containing protein [Flavobacterium silvisoli]TBX70663.1 T9SS type A sorting domain-containing protein [Flavobacterium silvisoli]